MSRVSVSMWAAIAEHGQRSFSVIDLVSSVLDSAGDGCSSLFEDPFGRKFHIRKG